MNNFFDYSPNPLCNELGVDHDFIIAVTRARKRELELWCTCHGLDPNDKKARDEWIKQHVEKSGVVPLSRARLLDLKAAADSMSANLATRIALMKKET